MPHADGLPPVRVFGEARWDVTSLRGRLGIVSASLHQQFVAAVDEVLAPRILRQKPEQVGLMIRIFELEQIRPHPDLLAGREPAGPVAVAVTPGECCGAGRLLANPVEHREHLVAGRRRHFLRRHLPGGDHPPDSLPGLAGGGVLEVGRPAVEPHVAFLLRVAMTLHAVPLQERGDMPGEVRGRIARDGTAAQAGGDEGQAPVAVAVEETVAVEEAPAEVAVEETVVAEEAELPAGEPGDTVLPEGEEVPNAEGEEGAGS